ncbi:MAG TPA: hypothetical protein VL282_04440, partial [Tepidisphaeraceae bacterium]|nr:hypothetical protein [Tepidisphaeraceae bacterium]
SVPRIALLNGMRAYVTATTDRDYVAGAVRRSTSSTTQSSSDLQKGLVRSGIVLYGKATFDPVANDFALHLKLMFSRLLEMKNEPADSDDKNSKVFVQTPVVENVRFDRRCVIPMGKTLLLHAERDLINGPTTQPTSADVYLAVTPSLLVEKK